MGIISQDGLDSHITGHGGCREPAHDYLQERNVCMFVYNLFFLLVTLSGTLSGGRFLRFTWKTAF
jgi:hypothetical protein